MPDVGTIDILKARVAALELEIERHKAAVKVLALVVSVLQPHRNEHGWVHWAYHPNREEI